LRATEAPLDVEPVADIGPEPVDRSWPRRHRRPLVGGAVLALVLLAVGAGVSWHFSSEVLVPVHSRLAANATVDALAPGRIVLARAENTLRPGVYGLEWPAGHAVLEEVLTSDAHTVTRRLSAVRGRLAPGMRVAVDNDLYTGNPTQALGLAFANVSVPGERGAMPAWLIPGQTRPAQAHPGLAGPRQARARQAPPTQTLGQARTWAIVVHGINGNREGDLYVVPALHRAGVPALLVTYREDVGAPSSPDGLHHMGLTEWRDLAAAARYALAHGAQRLVLVGASMGGAIVSQFMEHSPLAGRVAGLVLDAPALSWKAVLSFNASEMGLPSFAVLPVEWMIDLRIAPDWGSLDALDHPASFHLPILLFHGTADRLVPISSSDAFAKELPGWVTYYRVPEAGHVESWNVDRGLYEQRLGAFLGRIGA
jgi:pimeloyl-ACP methyl ester carboxylesterase